MSLDWIKCIICQESTKEALRCPLNSNGSPEANQQTYLAFLQNANSFREANALPTELKFGDNVDVDCLCLNQGSWHKSCHLKFSLSKPKKLKSVLAKSKSKTAKQTRRKDLYLNVGNASVSLKSNYSVYSVLGEAKAISFTVFRCWKPTRASVKWPLNWKILIC